MKDESRSCCEYILVLNNKKVNKLQVFYVKKKQSRSNKASALDLLKKQNFSLKKDLKYFFIYENASNFNIFKTNFKKDIIYLI